MLLSDAYPQVVRSWTPNVMLRRVLLPDAGICETADAHATQPSN